MTQKLETSMLEDSTALNSHNVPRLLAKTSGTSLDLAGKDYVTFNYASPATIQTFSNVSPGKVYPFVNVNNQNITIDRTAAYLADPTSITLGQYDVVMMVGYTATTLMQCGPVSANA